MNTRLLILAVMALAALLAQPAAAADPKEDKAKERSAKIAREQMYMRTIKPEFLIAGPYVVSLPRDGQVNQSGNVTVTIEAKDVATRTLLANNQKTVDGILFPLTVELFAKGRPSRTQLQAYKAEAIRRLDSRFKDMIKDVYLTNVM